MKKGDTTFYIGDSGWVQTTDPRFKRPMLYLLSYGVKKKFGKVGRYPN